MDEMFEWDADKASTNLVKHGVSFEEAQSVFLDPESLTIPDPTHSVTEDRFVISGYSILHRQLVVVITERDDKIRLISARTAIDVSDKNMSKKKNDNGELLDHYDFSGGVRGKYVQRARKSSHVVVLEADVAEVFTSSESVNQTLRGLLPIINADEEKSTRP